MKIAMISSGNSIHVKKIANAMADRGHEITLFTLPNHNKLLPDFAEGIHVVKLPVGGSIGYVLNAPYIRYYLKRHKVDLINSHFASGYGTLARLVGKHPLALAVFGSDVYEYPYKSKINMRNIIKNLDFADVITSTSRVMEKEVRKFYRKDRPIYVTPFGVDLRCFHPVKVAKDGCFEVGIVKKIEKKYGIEYLLQAFKILREEYGVLNSRLVIFGRGSALEEYMKLSGQMGLSDSVSFKGFVQNEKVPEVLSHMDVACFPSVYESESFGVAAVEAMACGLPVVTSDVSGFKEVMVDNVTGFIVKKKDAKELAAALYRVYRMTPEEKRKMGMAGLGRVKELYDFDDNMRTYEEAVKKALTGNV